ncbi:BatD family protein [Flavobacterium agrisoli]|uniref:BatD family protein n=1 Tax=Flavobacterium agrisoli TaxID=2793066 RepID=A0A934UK17_9FLAO|nr:BatD family protein [Flavobacterium agrisoli]MBK0370098.1 BatD family protein [Flavobacterium agrisoli]
MVKKLKIVLFLFLIGHSFGYGQKMMSYVTINHQQAYMGQPIEMTVSAYTSTWFTAGVDVGNIQIEGALNVYFRSVSNSKDINGTHYAGVDLIFHIFPTKEGKITIPKIGIHVESPKDGDYKGIKHILYTRPKTITVKPVPLGYDPTNWLAAGNLSINQQWSRSLQGIKVGDVVIRKITRSAAGTVGEFIPAVKWDSVAGVSIYPKRPYINTNKSKLAVSASRTESANYLFEKEGKVTLPRIEFVYWNYANRRFYKRYIDAVTITVAPNPDLKMLSTLKKQLSAESGIEEKEKPFLILGMTVEEFLKLVALVVIVLYVVYKIAQKTIPIIKEKYTDFIQSEKYAFRKALKSVNSKNEYTIFQKLKIWIGKLNPEIENFSAFVAQYGTEELQQQFILFEQQFETKVAKTSTFDASLFKKELKKSRKNYFEETKKIHDAKNKIAEKKWINPIK